MSVYAHVVNVCAGTKTLCICMFASAERWKSLHFNNHFLPALYAQACVEVSARICAFFVYCDTQGN